ncbi:hypothetical protein JCM3770_005019 [Rhodotorula araucariae]
MSPVDSHEVVRPAVDLEGLPQELLAEIITLVSETDDEVRSTALVEVIPNSLRATGGSSASVQDGRSSDWCSHGIGALSLVNKSLRRLTLPHICKHVTCPQLSLPVVQFGRIPADLLADVETLDLRSGTS